VKVLTMIRKGSRRHSGKVDTVTQPLLIAKRMLGW
jgi:hypothetical protein